MTRYTIDRNTWLRGEGEENSSLYRTDDGKMCCLGQIANQCGIPMDAMAGKETPAILLTDAEGRSHDKIKWLVLDLGSLERPYFLDSAVARSMMSSNDDTTIDDEEREKQLTELALKAEVALVFVDGEPSI